VLKLLHESHQMALVDSLVKVKPGQFYGIEIEDFPCQVAQLSILLMKHLMDRDLSDHFGVNIIDFPIRENANIVCGNALRLDWNEVCPAEDLDFIIGNPPFIGTSYQSKEQKDDMAHVFKDYRKTGNLDFVASWFQIAGVMIENHPHIRAAFVSTNSIYQGEQVSTLWGVLLKKGIEIQFAYRTFKWSNEAKSKAAVHCVIAGFGIPLRNEVKTLYLSDGISRVCANISPYLVDAPTIIVEPANNPMSGYPPMSRGNQPTDGGFLILSTDEKEQLITEYPVTDAWIRRYMGGKDLLHEDIRWCLWLTDVDIREIRKIPPVWSRILKVKETRLASTKKATQEKANTPWLFDEIHQPSSGSVIALPSVSSENREYVPMVLMDCHTIFMNKVYIVPDGTLYLLGLLLSSAHNAWIRTVAGRLKSDINYSNTIVYNSYPWPEEQQSHIEAVKAAAQDVLSARETQIGWTLAQMYDLDMMPVALRKAHTQLDRAVWEAYDRAWPIGDESACVAHLMKLYQAKVSRIC